LPREFGDDSGVHRTFRRWVELGLMERLRAVLVGDCEELGGVDWEWQSFDCALGKARHPGHRGGIESERTQRTGRSKGLSAGSLPRAAAGRWRWS
jgi:hypothetical protein